MLNKYPCREWPIGCFWLLSLHSVTDHLGLMELFQEIVASLVRLLECFNKRRPINLSTGANEERGAP